MKIHLKKTFFQGKSISRFGMTKLAAFGLICCLLALMIKAEVEPVSSSSDSEIMNKIKTVREDLETKPIPKDKYLDTLQISYGRNRNPNVVSYGVTFATFSKENVSDSNVSFSQAHIENDTSIIELEVFSLKI